MRILLAFSGGLDTSYLLARLVHEEGHAVTALTVDCGGFSPSEKTALRARALALGAEEHLFPDARAELFERVIRWLLAGNVRRGGVYPLCVGAERGLQAEILARLAREQEFLAVAHGCTGAGNDQFRFEAALAVVAPELEVLAPVRDRAPARSEQCAWLAEQGFAPPPSGGRFSINAGLWGLTIGGGPLLDTRDPLPEEAWQWTRDGSGEARIRIGFRAGIPGILDGEALDPVVLIERLNRLGGRLGVGRGYHLGDTVLGIKGRIGFEAPAAEMLLGAHAELEKLVLTEEQRFWKDHLGEVYGRRLHQGLFHDPFLRDVEAFLASSQKRVTGTVRLHLAGGRVTVEGLASPFDMLRASAARYGERPDPALQPAAAAAMARILAEPARLHRLAASAGGETGA